MCIRDRAVDSPHTFHPESFTYEELAKNISIAASAFSQVGVEPDEVVALFSENSPRWLIADQGLMRIGATDSVRGATAPPSELRYILEDSNAVGLIVQNSDVWEKLSLNDNQIKNLKFKKLKICEDYLFKCEILKKQDAYKCEGVVMFYRISKNSLQSNKLRNVFWIWHINKNHNKFTIFQNLKSIFLISINSLKKYGFK